MSQPQHRTTMDQKAKAIKHTGPNKRKSSRPRIEYCLVCGSPEVVLMGHCRECLDPLS